jgi:hypothetical protein
MGDARIVSAETEIRQALSTKGKRYGELDAPHLIVVLLAETVHVRQSRFERQGADCKLVVEEERIDREVRRFHTMSVAGLWRDQGKREARDLLAPVYGWFTEGFDTLDLKEAKLDRRVVIVSHRHRLSDFSGYRRLIDGDGGR